MQGEPLLQTAITVPVESRIQFPGRLRDISGHMKTWSHVQSHGIGRAEYNSPGVEENYPVTWRHGTAYNHMAHAEPDEVTRKPDGRVQSPGIESSQFISGSKDRSQAG